MDVSVPSLILATGVVGLSVVSVMLILYTQHRDVAGYGSWITGVAFQTAGLLVLSLRDVLPDDVRLVLGNGIYTLAPFAYLRTAARLLALRAPLRAVAWLTVATIVMIVILTFVIPSGPLRVGMVGAHTVVVLAITLRLMTLGLRSEPSLAYRTLFVLVLGIALTMLWRTVWLLANPSGGTIGDPPSTLLFLSSLVFLSASGIAFIGVLEDRNRRAFIVANLELTRLSRTDDLTGLANRRHFDEVLETEVARAARYRRPLSLVLFDLDQFKAVNDSLGHATGDRVLRRVAQVLRSTSRVNDLAARTGGEEFAMLLPETGPDDAHRIAERVRERIQAAALPSGRGTLPLTTSAGVTSLEPTRPAVFDGDDAQAAAAPNRIEFDVAARLVERADEALYEAKRAGRDRTVAATTLRLDALGGASRPTVVERTCSDTTSAD